MAVLTVEKIRALFVQEAEGRLALLGQLLLDLEQPQPDGSLVDSVFRELHTIKGSAAVAELPEVSTRAHGLEDVVAELRSGARTVTPEVVDALLAGTDELSALIAQVASGARPEPLPVAISVSPARLEPVTAPEPPDVQSGPASLAAVSIVAAPPRVATRPPPVPTSAHTSGMVMAPLERLEELSRLVSESASAHLRVGRMLSDRFGTDPASLAEFNELSRLLNDLQDRAMRTQMVAVSTITEALQRTVRDLARVQGKQIRWEARGTETELDRGVLLKLSDSLVHLVRNAVDHGIETPQERVAAGKPDQASIRIHAMQLGSEVIIAVTDDGRGINLERVREEAALDGVRTEGMNDEEVAALTLTSGLSTAGFVTDVSGRGVGLDVVRTNVEAVRGRIEVRSTPGQGAEFRLIVPITLAVLRCLLVEAGGIRYALPFHRVVRSQADDESRVSHAEGRELVWVDRQPVPLSVLAETLGTGTGPHSSGGPIVVLADSARRHAFKIDRLLGQRDVVLKGLSHVLPTIPAVAGASVEPDGSVLLVLDPPGLIHRAQHSRPSLTPVAGTPLQTERARRILVVDDALTVRELQRSILERAQFTVRVASDGLQALALLAEEPSDLVLTDVEMPHMDGFALTEAIRADPQLANIPVVILTSRSSADDRQRGLDVGADGYIIKSGFDESGLLTAVNRLLGRRR